MASNKYGIEFYTFESLFNKTVQTIQDLNLSPKSKVLDVPAGPGALTQILNEDFGFETSAAEFITSNWKYDKLPVSFADLSISLPYQDDEFDLTICLEGLKHVYNLNNAISELARVTKSGGYILITVPNDLNMQTKFRYVWDSFVDTDWSGPIDSNDEMVKRRWYVGSLIQFPYLYNLLKIKNVEFLFAHHSRVRVLSLFLMYLFYPIIYFKTNKTCKTDKVLRGQLLSRTWLAGRHCIMVCKKP